MADVINIGNKVTVATVGEISTKVTDALLKTKSLILKSESIQDFDLSLIQMMLSLKKTCQEKQITLGFEINFTEEQVLYLQRLNIVID